MVLQADFAIWFPRALGMSFSTRGSVSPEENGLDYNGIFFVRMFIFIKLDDCVCGMVHWRLWHC